jgi:outer membrane receptor for ferrienterochelin and colicins
MNQICTHKAYIIGLLTIFLTITLTWLQAQDVKSDTASLEELMNLQLDDNQIRKNMDNTKVVSASKSKENLASAPGLVSVVTKQDIQSFGALTMVDVLNRVTSMYVMGSFAFPDNLATLRGDLQTQSASHVLVLINGRPCRESFYGGLDMAIFTSFSLESIERIEVIRGPGSVLYGTNAYTGVINLITKVEKKNIIEGTLKAGSFGTGVASYYQSVNFKDLNVNLNAQYLNQNGWDFNATDQNEINRTIKYSQRNIGLNLNATFKNFTFSSFYGNSNRNVFGTLRTIWKPDTINQPDFNKLKTYRAFADLGYKYSFSDKFKVTINGTYNGFTQNSVIAFAPAKYYSNDFLVEATAFISPIQDFNIVIGGLANRISGRGEGKDFYKNNENVDWVKPYTDVRLAAYCQIDYRPIRYLKLFIGGQANKAPNLALNFVPRGGVILNFTPEFGMKAMYGQAFKYAAQFERFANIPFSRIYGDSTLKPEIVTTLDLQLFIQKSNYQMSAAYFLSQQKDVVITQTHPTVVRAQQYSNLGSLQFQGVELEGKWLPIQQLVITGSATYQSNVNSAKETENTAIASTMIKLGIAYNNKYGNIGIFNSYYSSGSKKFEQNSLLVNPAASAFNLASLNVSADICTIFNLKNIPQISLNAYVNNLLDEKIYNPELARNFINSIPAAGGRAVYIGVSVKI